MFASIRRICRIVFVERRLPGRVHQLYFSLLNKLGVRLTTIKLKNGFTIKGYTHCFFMFYEIWSKKDYDIPGFEFAQNMNVVDIGANQGFFSLYAASKGATVYAFEPCTDNFEILKWNVLTNGLEDKVKLFNVAVTREKGTVDLFVGLDEGGRILSGSVSVRNEDRGGKGVRRQLAESITLNSLLHDLSIERCDFLKMDCEGAEYEILEGTSPASFNRIARTSIECHENRMQEAVSVLKRAGFNIVCARGGEADILKATNMRAFV